MAQSLELNLNSANSQVYQGRLYCYGIRQELKKNNFQIYQLDFHLKKLDSLSIETGKSVNEIFLQCQSDTLHGFLNVYVQKKEKNLVSIFRFNTSFELVSQIENVDIARLNSISVFNHEMYYTLKGLYSISIQLDTSGKQFYLNKYVLKSEVKNFDYESKWQFPFERKNIQSAHIFYANNQAVYLHVYVHSGPKSGQWILKINAENGRLIKGTRLNEKGEENVYSYGKYLFETNSKSLTLLGEKFSPLQFDSEQNKLKPGSEGMALIYYIQLDSIGDVIMRREFKIPFTEGKTQAKKTSKSFFMQLTEFEKISEGKFHFVSDLYVAPEKSNCFAYSNSIDYLITTPAENLVLEKKNLSPNAMIESFLFTNDKLDMNGKLCADSSNRIEQLFYKELSLPVKLQFKRDSSLHPVWILTKSQVKKANISYHLLKPNKAVYEIKLLEEIPKASQPAYFKLNGTLFIITRQDNEVRFIIKLFNW